jgi:hypothetical protein
VWSRDGRELFFVAEAGLVSVSIEPGNSFLFGAPRVVLKGATESYWLSANGRPFDVAADGQRFLMLKPEQRGAAQIHVVLNWHEELKRAVPTN